MLVTLIAILGVESEGIGGPGFFAGLGFSASFLASGFLSGLPFARSSAVRSPGVGKRKNSLIGAAFFPGVFFSGACSLGTSLMRSTVIIPFSR